MRLFLGIFPPEEVQKRIYEELGEARRKIKGVKWEPPEKLHITLRFLGEVPDRKIKEITERLKEIEYREFDVELKGIGFFPNERRPRVIWVGMGRGYHDLMVLSELLDPRFPDSRFHPHLTVGRVKSRPENLEFLDRYRKTSFGEFRVREFWLVRSYLEPGGSRYEKVKEFCLGKGGEKI